MPVLLRKIIGVDDSSEAGSGMVRNGGPYAGAIPLLAMVASSSTPQAVASRVDHQSDQRSVSLPKGRPEIDSSAQVAVGVNRSSRSLSTSMSVPAPRCIPPGPASASREYSILGLLAAIDDRGDKSLDDGGTNLR